MKVEIDLPEIEGFKLLKEAIKYDSSTGKLYWIEANGSRVKAGDEAGSVNSHGYRRVLFKSREFMVHRFIYWLETGEIPEVVDHVNREILDNHISNLRAATVAENRCNSKANSNNKLGIKNVHKDGNKYRVTITKDKKTISLGSFHTLEFAELVAMEAREKYHGRFSCHAKS